MYQKYCLMGPYKPNGFARQNLRLSLMLLVLSHAIEAGWTLRGSSSAGVVGELFTLTCTPDRSYTIDTIAWRRNDSPLKEINKSCTPQTHGQYSYTCDGDLVFNLTIPASSMTSSQHNTNWTCWGPVFGGRADYTLLVKTPVTSVTIKQLDTGYPGVPVVYENEAKTFECVTDGSNPRATVTVTINGVNNQQINGETHSTVNGLHVTSRTFTITPTGGDQGKTIICSAVNIQGRHPVTQTITLDVYYTPTITLDTTPIMVEEGSSINEACSATGSPTPVVKWYRGNIELTSGTGASASLTYSNIDRGNTDTYTCRATAVGAPNKVLKSEATLTVTVQYPPTARVVVPNDVTENAVNVEIICNITNGVPATNTFHGWSQSIGGTVIRSGLSGTADGNNNKLLFPSVTFEDTGDYKCEVSNGIKGRQSNVNQSASASIGVKVSAKFNSNDRRQAAEQNKDATLSFPFYSNPHALLNNIIWTNESNGAMLTKSNSILFEVINATVKKQIRNKFVSLNGQIAKITFKPFRSHYVGNYTIDITNGGSLSSSFIFEIGASAPPDKPVNFGVLDRTANSITLTWTAGFNGGHPQTFVVQYSKSDNVIEETIKETPPQINYTYTVKGLDSSTKYQFLLYSKNIEGNSSLFSTTALGGETKAVRFEEPGNNAGTIAGVIIAVIVIVAAVVIGVVCYKRRKSPGGKSKSFDSNGKRPLAEKEESEQEDGMRHNILYESADSDPKFAAKSKLHGAGGGDLYSEARNQQTGPLDPSIHYAVVQKDTKPDTAGPLDPAVIYSEPDKPKKDKKVTAGAKPKEKSHKEKGGAKAKTKAQPGKEPEPVLYEVVGGTGKTNLAITNEKPSHTGDKGKKKKQKQAETKKNQDGLTYVDLDLTTPQKKGKKGVVHGMENRTEYSEVDFNRHANPLPPDENDNV